MRLLLTLILSFVATVAHAATVTGTIQDANGDATTVRVEFWPLTTPLQTGDALITTGRPVRTTATDGVLSVSLVEGLYQVRIGGYDKIKISVPSGSASYEIGTLTSDGITYIPPGAVGGSVNVAQTLFVDAANGSDSTGERGDMSKPFLSISNAIASAQSGDTIVIRPGTYTIDAEAEYYSTDTATITPTWYVQSKTNLTLLGYGARMVSTTYGHLLTIENSKNITIEGIEFSYPTNSIGSHGIAAAINHRGTNTLTTVRNCRFVNIADQCVSHCWSQYGRPSSLWTITGCYFENIGIANHPALGSADGSLVSGRPQKLIFSNNRSAGTNYGPMIEFDGAGGTGMTNRTLGEATITGNVLDGIYKYGLVGISTATNSTYRLTVTGNVFRELDSGYASNGNSLNLFYGVRDATISDNVYIAGRRATTNSPSYGIAILKHPTAADPTLSLSTNITISGNVFDGGSYGIWALNGVRGLNISGNTFKGQGFDSVLAWADGGLIANNLFLGAGVGGQAGASMLHLWRNDSEELDNVFINGNMFYDQEPTPATAYAVYLQPNGYGMTNVVLGNNMIHTLAAASTNYYLSTASIAPANFRGKVETDSQFWAEDGTTAYPGYAFSSNPDTGFYLSSSNIVVSLESASEHWFRPAGFATAPDNLIGWYGEGYTDIDTRFVRVGQGIVGLISSGSTNALRFTEGNAPPTPSSGYGYLYVSGDGKPYFKDDTGTETSMLGADHTGVVDFGGTGTITNAAGIWVSNITATGSMTVSTLNIGRVLTPFNNLTLDSTNLVVDCASTNTFGIIELTGDCYIIASNLTAGARAQIEVRADGTARTITAVPDYKASGAESFSLTVTNHAVISLFNTGTATTNVFIGGAYFE